MAVYDEDVAAWKQAFYAFASKSFPPRWKPTHEMPTRDDALAEFRAGHGYPGELRYEAMRMSQRQAFDSIHTRHN